MVTKTFSGDVAEGYPRTYYGMQAFTYGGVDYPLIDTDALAVMAVSTYQARLAAFISHVEEQEVGLAVSEAQTNEPYF